MEKKVQASQPGETGPVLVVEDETEMLQVITWVLEEEGLNVRTASNGQEAVDHAQRQRPSLVVLDMGLPVLSGFGVAEELHARHGDEVPILVVTADGRAAEKARHVGAFAYLQKPFNLDDLVAAVHRGLSG
jgi:DNA-binding response OmpR family regulator